MTKGMHDIESIRKQFPLLHEKINGKPLVYFDNAATTQKPQRVLDALNQYYTHDNANIHRAAHSLAARATEYFEATRKTVQQFIHAAEVEEVIFTKGVTESINLVAQTYGRSVLKPGDEVLITGMEHHSNIVPWQMICEEKGATLRVIPVNDAGELLLDSIDTLLTIKTKILSCVWVSNALGTINPVKKLIEYAHTVGAVVLLDGAQACAHLEVDVQDLDCDFLAMSSHKLYGPTGVGVLYGKRALLEAMPPYQGGGEMIQEVTFAKTTYNELPYKFEAGTPNIADVIAFGQALEFVNETGKDTLSGIESGLMEHCSRGFDSINEKYPGNPPLVRIGTAHKKISVQSFILPAMHPFDVGMMLDARGIAVRTGHHCTQPLMRHFGLEGTIRASFAAYNTVQEIDVFIQALENIVRHSNK